MAGVLGIEVPLKGYKKAKSLYKKYKDAKNKLEEGKKGEEPEDPDGIVKQEVPEAPEVDEGGGASGSTYSQEAQDRILNRIPKESLPDSNTASETNLVNDQPLLAEGERSGAEALESDATSFGSRVVKAGSDALDTLKSGLNKVGDFVKGAKNKLFSSAGKDAGKAVGKEVGEDEAVGVFDSVVGGIPLLGEGALAITGLISIGRAFAHLFKHKKHFQPKTPQAIGVAIPQANTDLTQKYSMGLPSIDSASEVSASFSAF